jgi:tetratricopeptide (TPR) repeat protein
LCLIKFEIEQRSSDNGMPLSQIRDAAIASRFPSREALDRWLSVAIGDHYSYLDRALRHARRAVRLCPLLGDGYVYLAELHFLEGGKTGHTRDYLQQATTVRPYSAAVSFAAGQEAALSGDIVAALKHFKAAYDQEPFLRAKIIELFASQNADFFMQHFELDLEGMKLLRAHYRRLGNEEQAKKIGLRYVATLQQEIDTMDAEQAAAAWLEAQIVYQSLGNEEQARRCAGKALEISPNDYNLRRRLADLLLEQQRFAEAAEQLRWCLRRYPESGSLQQKLERATREPARAERTWEAKPD